MSHHDERRPLSAAHPLPAVSGKGNTDSGERERLLTAADLGEILGLTAGTILDRFQRGDLPGYRLFGRKGGPVRFRVDDVEAWLAGCRVEASPR